MHLPLNTRKLVFLFCSLIIFFEGKTLFSKELHTAGPTLQANGEYPICSVLNFFGGNIQMMDESRTKVIEVKRGVGVPCGAWISVDSGWAKFEHRSGFQFYLGSASFGQFIDDQVESMNKGDHFLLYKGQVFTAAGNGSGEVRVVTANGRARIKRGTAVINFSQTDEDTQLIVLDQSATLENRFQTASYIRVKAGEASSLNFKALRTVPSTPRTVSIAGLKQKLTNMHIDDREISRAIANASDRMNRRFPADLLDTSWDPQGLEKKKRAEKKRERLKSYERHKRTTEDSELKDYFESKSAGIASENKVEKRKLIQELSKIEANE